MELLYNHKLLEIRHRFLEAMRIFTRHAVDWTEFMDSRELFAWWMVEWICYILIARLNRQVRLSFQLAHQNGDENEVMEHHKELRDVPEDQLCLAAIHFLRGHYQDAIDIYKRLVLQNKDMIALHVYIALCYYKLDFYDVSQEVLSIYLQKNQDSLIAINLKACNVYRLYNGRAAETEIRTLIVCYFNWSVHRF